MAYARRHIMMAMDPRPARTGSVRLFWILVSGVGAALGFLNGHFLSDQLFGTGQGTAGPNYLSLELNLLATVFVSILAVMGICQIAALRQRKKMVWLWAPTTLAGFLGVVFVVLLPNVALPILVVVGIGVIIGALQILGTILSKGN